ncbi:MAG TPA: DUF4124 domain-containing protein [Methylibium sp.]|nr:DUF4124 domain-containing protein [Methylibium sp.]
MNTLRAALLVLACASTPLALAQWQWVDKDGRKVFSDQPPPASVPADKILKRPGSRPAVAAEPEAAPAAPKAAAASAPKVTGKDKELEDKRKAVAAAEAEKKRQHEEEVAKARSENCTRAKQAKATIDSGVRLTVTNAKGEREIMDDAARAAETKRLQVVIDRDCKAS